MEEFVRPRKGQEALNFASEASLSSMVEEDEGETERKKEG